MKQNRQTTDEDVSEHGERRQRPGGGDVLRLFLLRAQKAAAGPGLNLNLHEVSQDQSSGISSVQCDSDKMTDQWTGKCHSTDLFGYSDTVT